jgi:hypothetical protein
MAEAAAPAGTDAPDTRRNGTVARNENPTARKPLWTALILLALFVAAWAPRIWQLNAFVTPDERKWLARSANFYQAVAEGDAAATFQREHPGVTVMWAGTLGLLQRYPTYPTETPGPFAWDREHFEAWLAETGGPDPLDLLTAGRWWVVLAISLAAALSFLPLRLLFGAWPAALAALWVAWDPFAVALSRQLHPDGLVSVLSFLALLAFLAWIYGGGRWRWLILSGVVMGLAWLTKTPAIFLVVVGGLLLVAESLRRERTPAQRRRLWMGFVLWGAVATATFVLLWPAMWVDPMGTLQRMAGEMGEYVERHTNINYFWGAPTEDPGLLFYPVAWFFRTTPAVLLGLAAAAWLAIKRVAPLRTPVERRTAVALLLFAFVFAVGMSLGAKKFDRYILPAFLALDVVAALGWAGVAALVAQRVRRRGGASAGGQASWVAPAGVVAVGLIALHGLFVPLHAPYYLTYFNPLAGGSRTAPFALWVGWGEGLDAAAHWINEQPDGAQARTASFYYDGPFSYFADGPASNLGYGSPLFWLGMDYAVTYINQTQRRIPDAETVAWFESRTPAHTVRFRGLDLAHVYDLRDAPLPDFLDIAKARAADFGGVIRLLAYDFESVRVAPGDALQATLYLSALAPMERDYNVLLRLVGAEGEEIWRGEGWPWGAPTSNWPPREVRPDGHRVVIPADADPGLYQVRVSFYDPETLDLLDAATLDGAPLPDAERTLALLQVTGGEEAVPPAPAFTFGDALALDAASLVEAPAAGEVLQLLLEWRSLARLQDDWTVFVHIMGPAGSQGESQGAPVAQRDAPPLGGFAATSLLQPGQRLLDHVEVALPADLPAGEYSVRVGLYQGDRRLPATTSTGEQADFATVATFTLP